MTSRAPARNAHRTNSTNGSSGCHVTFTALILQFIRHIADTNGLKIFHSNHFSHFVPVSLLSMVNNVADTQEILKGEVHLPESSCFPTTRTSSFTTSELFV
jgi:hypothetical protein